jgi:hypothetical protein
MLRNHTVWLGQRTPMGGSLSLCCIAVLQLSILQCCLTFYWAIWNMHTVQNLYVRDCWVIDSAGLSANKCLKRSPCVAIHSPFRKRGWLCRLPVTQNCRHVPALFPGPGPLVGRVGPFFTSWGYEVESGIYGRANSNLGDTGIVSL